MPRTTPPTAVTGTFGATGQSATYYPMAEKPFVMTLMGTFVATVQLERSNDDGVTWTPVSRDTAGNAASFSAPTVQVIDDPSGKACYRLNCTAYTSGTVAYSL